MSSGVVAIPAVLLVLALGFTVFAIVKFRGTARIVAGVLGGLVTVVLGFATLIAVVVHSFAASQFNPDTYKGPIGQLQLPYKCPVRLAMGCVKGRVRRGTVYFRSENGLVKMPVGTYQVLSYTITDPRGVSWGGSFYDAAPHVTVEAGRTVQFKVGEPMVVSLKVDQAGRDQMSVTPEVKGCAGEECNLPGLRGFQILSKSRQVLMEDKFKFG